jgi:putative ABC transport system ATP-binding protein
VKAVEATAVTKTYGSGNVAYQALRGVDFSVEQGEFVMLSGPSGSGKTTLLSILGCVLHATSGQVKLFGKDVSNVPESQLPDLRLEHIGFVFQGHNLIASLNAQDNVALMLELRGQPRKTAVAEAQKLLDSVGLGDKLASKPGDLSGGQRQRVAIARALAGSPPLILADEPTASLDAQAGQTVTQMLKTLTKQSGKTVIVVTHDNRIYHFADRIVNIEDGHIV